MECSTRDPPGSAATRDVAIEGITPSFGNHDWAQHLARGKTPAPIPAEESLPGDSGLQDREEVWDPGYRRHLPPPPSPKHPAASRARYPAPGKRRGPAGQRAQVAAAAGGTCEKGRGERERSHPPSCRTWGAPRPPAPPRGPPAVTAGTPSSGDSRLPVTPSPGALVSRRTGLPALLVPRHPDGFPVLVPTLSPRYQ